MRHAVVLLTSASYDYHSPRNRAIGRKKNTEEKKLIISYVLFIYSDNFGLYGSIQYMFDFNVPAVKRIYYILCSLKSFLGKIYSNLLV